MAGIRIGISGWHYASWRGAFFPSGLMVKHQLSYYASQFETTELNGVFYRTPSTQTVESWRDHTGQDFIFAWKASLFITHWKRLLDTSAGSLKLLEQRLSLLGEKAEPVLFQLPPNMKADHQRLAPFLKLLHRKWRYTFEFRHPSRYTPQTMRLLADRNIALCISDHHDAPSPWERTADFIYVRGHGPGGRYKDHCSPQTLRDWNGSDVDSMPMPISTMTRKVQLPPCTPSEAADMIARFRRSDRFPD